MMDQPVIVFDGQCVLCSASAQFVLRRDRHRRFRLCVAQSDVGRRFYREAGLDPDAMATMIVVADGRVHVESNAALAVLEGLGWPWRIAGVARIVPAMLRDPVYRFVARNRYRWFGRRDTCWLPDPSFTNRLP
jgi:predicted DCC family thiol-disulfide oxidoreductase YuxK